MAAVSEGVVSCTRSSSSWYRELAVNVWAEVVGGRFEECQKGYGMENTPGWKRTEIVIERKGQKSTDHEWCYSRRVDSLAFGYCHGAKRSSMIATYRNQSV